jgi:hypothetical protein
LGRGLSFDCTLTGVGKASGGAYDGALTLPHGQLAGESAFGRSGEAHRQAITGGMGRYRGARGKFVVGKDSGPGTHVVVELLR